MQVANWTNELQNASYFDTGKGGYRDHRAKNIVTIHHYSASSSPWPRLHNKYVTVDGPWNKTLRFTSLLSQQTENSENTRINVSVCRNGWTSVYHGRVTDLTCPSSSSTRRLSGLLNSPSSTRKLHACLCTFFLGLQAYKPRKVN